MTLTVKERIDQSLAILQDLDKNGASYSLQEKETLNFFLRQFGRMNKDLKPEQLKAAYEGIKSLSTACLPNPPAPTPTKDTKIPAVPKASKPPAKKDFSEIKGPVCKQLPTELGSNTTSSSRDGKAQDDLKQPDKPTFDWGIKFTYDPTEQNYGLTCIPNTGMSLNNSEGKQEWYMTLLPAMKSQIPKSPGMDTPNAMPGLQFQLKSNIAKHRIPGSQPVYQHLGVDTVMVTIVGCFTGDGGKKTRQEMMTSPVNYANSMNPNISKDGRTINKIKLTEEERKLFDVANSVATNLALTSPISRTGKEGLANRIIANGYRNIINPKEIEPLLESIEKKGYVWRSGLNKFIGDDPSQAEVDTYNRSSKDPHFINDSTKTFLDKGRDSNLATRYGENLTTRNTLKNEGVNTTWIQNPNMRQCEPCIGVVEQAERLDSYHEFTSFQRLSYNRELEVEINLAKNNDGRAPQKNKYEEWGWNATSAKTQKDADWGPLRNGENGNPRFKGVIRGIEAYYARQDRTWYLMTIEVTDLGLSSDVPLNLIKELTEAAEAAVEDTKETADPTKDLQNRNARLDCILQQGNGMFTDPDDVLGTTNRAYIAGNIAGGGELLAWDMYTGEGMKYKIETTSEGNKELKYAKANSPVLTPHEVGQVLADTKVDLISAASGGVGRIRVDTDVRKQFFLTMYERGAIDYKPKSIGEDVLQSEVVGNISSGNNEDAEKALQEVCRSIYSTSRKFKEGEAVDGGTQAYTDTNRTRTTFTLPEIVTQSKGAITESQLGALINTWTSEDGYTEDHGVKIFQDLRMIKEGTCKGFALARANWPGAKWQVITPYGLFKQLLDSPNFNTDGDLSFILKYIDIKTNPYQSGYVAYANGSGSKDPGLKNNNQQVACFSDLRSGDMDPNTDGTQSIRDVNEGQYNQYDPLAAGDSLPLDGLNPIQYVLGVISAGISCGADFIFSIGPFLAGLVGTPATAGASTVAGTVLSGGLAILAGATCADTLGNLQAAAVGKREYDTVGGIIDLVTAIIPEALGRREIREAIKKFLGWLGKIDIIKVIGKGILDAFQNNTVLKSKAKDNPVEFIGGIWKSLIERLTKEAGVPDGDPIAAKVSDPNFFQNMWNWISRKGSKTPTTTLSTSSLTMDVLKADTQLQDILTALKSPLNNIDASIPRLLPKLTGELDVKPGDLLVSTKGELLEVVGSQSDSTGNYKGLVVKDTTGIESTLLAGTPDHDINLYKAEDIFNNKDAILNKFNPSTTPTPTVSPLPTASVSSSSNSIDGTVFKLQNNDPNIINALNVGGIKPISPTNLPKMGDTIVKAGDATTKYVVIGIDPSTKAIYIRNIATSKQDVANASDYYNLTDLEKVLTLPSNPHFEAPPVGSSPAPITPDPITPPPDSTATAPDSNPAVVGVPGTPPDVTGSATYGNSNNYVNTIIAEAMNENSLTSPPTNQDIFKAYSKAWMEVNASGMFGTRVPDMEQVLIMPITPTNIKFNIEVGGQSPSGYTSLFKNSQFIDSTGNILTYRSIDVSTQTISFTALDGSVIIKPLSSNEELFDISTHLTPTLVSYVKSQFKP